MPGGRQHTHTKIPETQTKTPTKPKGLSTKKALESNLNDKVTKPDLDSGTAKRYCRRWNGQVTPPTDDDSAKTLRELKSNLSKKMTETDPLSERSQRKQRRDEEKAKAEQDTYDRCTNEIKSPMAKN